MLILKELNVHEVLDKEKIIRFLQFDKKTLEYSFNEEEIIKNRWIYTAIDGSFLEEDEINRIISISKVNNFFCLNLNGLFNESSNKLTIYRFNNQVEDWIKILSPSEEYTLWDSLLFNNDNIIIIKPWSAGYNTLIAGEESVVRSICQDEHWLFNKKHPIYPL